MDFKKNLPYEKIISVRLPLRYVCDDCEERYIVLIEKSFETTVYSGHGKSIGVCKTANQLVRLISKLKDDYVKYETKKLKSKN